MMKFKMIILKTYFETTRDIKYKIDRVMKIDYVNEKSIFLPAVSQTTENDQQPKIT